MDNNYKSKKITQFVNQIESLPTLLKKANFIDQTLVSYFNQIKAEALSIIDELEKDKSEVVKNYDPTLKPAAKEVVESIVKDAEHLKSQLEFSLEHAQNLPTEVWTDQAKKWKKLYQTIHDSSEINNRVIKTASKRMQDLIHKDLQMIKDYQYHSIEQMSEDEEAVEQVETRLNEAISEPLKQLQSSLQELKEGTSQQKNIKQTAQWISNIQKKREENANTIFGRIDSLSKEIPQEYLGNQSELESEIAFMNYEIMHLENEMKHIKNDKEKEYILIHLRDLKEHIEPIKLMRIPKEMKEKLALLEERVDSCLARLNS